MTLVTQAEFAKRKNVSRAAVTQWKAHGQLVLVGKLIDFEATEAALLTRSSSRTKRGVPAAALVNQPVKPSAEPLNDHAATVVALVDGGAEDLAIILLARGMSRDEAQQIASAWLAVIRRGAAALLEEDVEVPAGFNRWADHPSLKAPFAPDWAELAAEALRLIGRKG